MSDKNVVVRLPRLAGILALAWCTGAIPTRADHQVTLMWDPSPDPDIADYILRYGNSPGVHPYATNVGNQTVGTVAGLQAGQNYCFVVTARNTAGLESDPSNEVTYQIPNEPIPPTIALTSPAAGASYAAPATIALAANVTANGNSIAKVQFLNGSTLVGEDTASPYAFTWANVSAGSYSLAARVVYGAGSTVDSSVCSVTVTNPPPPPPTIALTSPVAGSSYAAPATIALAANVTANGNSISKIQFFNGSTVLGEDTAPPYAFTWANVSAGSYSLAARAVYGAGSTVNSAVCPVTVTNPPPPPPTIALTSPAAGASYAAPATIALAASVTANGNSISKVQFFNGSTLLGEDTASPYTFTWANVSAGSYTLVARAVYGSGSVVDSASTLVSVSGLPAPWQSVDIGSVVSGSASASGGGFTVQGAGRLSGRSDTFQFVHQPLSGDGEIRVRVNSVDPTGSYGRIGVMMRETLNGNSRYAFMGLSPDGRFRFQRRSSTGGNTSSNSSGSGTPPDVWLRLVRTGNRFYAYRSSNGVNWSRLAYPSITMAPNIHVGLVVASGSTSTLNTSTFSSVTVVP